MELKLEKVVERLLYDAEFRAKVEQVRNILKADKPTPLDEEESAIIMFACGLTIMLMEEEVKNGTY